MDDCPLRSNESSESVLVATHFRNCTPVGKSSLSDDGCRQEFEDGFLTLITSDSPGLQVILINLVFSFSGLFEGFKQPVKEYISLFDNEKLQILKMKPKFSFLVSVKSCLCSIILE